MTNISKARFVLQTAIDGDGCYDSTGMYGAIVNALELLQASEKGASGEYWHMSDDGEGCAGPFTTVEDAKADAVHYLHDNRNVTERINILKVVATSSTETQHTTTWSDNAA
jgi:RecJ-like exonuclease